MPDRRCVPLFMQAPTTGDSGPVGVWITAAGWAAAAREIWGDAWLVSPEGRFSPEEALARASRPSLASRPPRWWRPFAPEIAVTAYKDMRALRSGRSFRKGGAAAGIRPADVAFVWQHHELFHSAGFAMAREAGRPLVLFVDAPVVWEDSKWGVRRPGWGRMLEAVAERPQLRRADLVCCVSEEIADEVRARGVPGQRIIVTPCAVHPDVFHPDVPGDDVRRRWGLEDRFVIGWAGSFRPFHGLELTLKAAALLQRSIPEIAVLLVGDGQERRRMQSLASRLGLRQAVFTGTVPHAEMPAHIAAMDVAVVASEKHDFHYSPIKLREYMACGRPIVASRAGQVGRAVTDGADGLLVGPGDASAVAEAVERLYRDAGLRLRLGSAARRTALEGSWIEQVRRVAERLARFDAETAGGVRR